MYSIDQDFYIITKIITSNKCSSSELSIKIVFIKKKRYIYWTTNQDIIMIYVGSCDIEERE